MLRGRRAGDGKVIAAVAPAQLKLERESLGLLSPGIESKYYTTHLGVAAEGRKEGRRNQWAGTRLQLKSNFFSLLSTTRRSMQVLKPPRVGNERSLYDKKAVLLRFPFTSCKALRVISQSLLLHVIGGVTYMVRVRVYIVRTSFTCTVHGRRQKGLST